MTPDQYFARYRDVRKNLSWFNINLADQIDDLELEAKGVRLDLFWDSFEVRRAVLGGLDFFDSLDPLQFEKAEFDEPRTMITCLAAQRWLGGIRMLEPHQAEFVRALRENFYRRDNWLTSAQLKAFFVGVALPDSEEFDLSKLGVRTDKQRQKLISAYAGEAGRLFKAVQCAKGTWRNRLATMYSGEILHFEQSSGIDYASIFASIEFQTLRHSLNELRKDKADNNVADAVCLCLLIQQVSSFRDNNSKSLPRFFETTSTFRDALKNADLTPLVSYFDQEGNSKTVLRGSDYFLFRAAFSVRDERVNSPFANVSLESLREIRNRLAEILKASEPLRSEELDEISVNGRPITSIIDDLKHMWILERIWLPFIASDELKLLDEDEKNRLEGFRPDPAMTTFVDAAIEKVTRALGDNVARYNHFSRLYFGIERHVSKLKMRYAKVAPERDRLYELSAVGRFGIPETFVPEIEGLLLSLALGEEEDSRRAAAELAKLCMTARTDKKARTTAIALLWIVEFHSAVLEFPNHLREESWLLAISASSAIEIGRATEARAAIRELEARYISNVKRIPDSATLAISLAYLYYHLWRLEGGYCKWKPDRRVKTLRSESELQQIAGDAIRYAETAYQNTTDAPTVNRLYAVNLLLFYLTEAGNDLQFQTTKRLADELTPWRTESSIWQYRYDDTLARYFHRRLLFVKDPASRPNLKRAHAKYLQNAAESSPDDPTVTAYLGVAANIDFDD